MNESHRLSTREQWSKKWEGHRAVRLPFNPNHPSFQDFHRLFQKHLPRDPNLRFLEVGCYPGRYLWYFHKYFGYQVDGLEYLEWACEETRRLLSNEGIEGSVIHADLFDYSTPPEEQKWDVVASAGLVEHFDDTKRVVQEHAALLREGGYLVLTLPNHSGLYGNVMKRVDPEAYEMHNQMDYERLHGAVEAMADLRILAGGYFGRFGFWASCLYETMHDWGRSPYIAVRGPLWIVEQAGRLLPNTARLSPYIALVARKHSKELARSPNRAAHRS